MTLKCEFESLKIIENSTIGELGYGFLFAIHSHFGDIKCHRMA